MSVHRTVLGRRLTRRVSLAVAALSVALSGAGLADGAGGAAVRNGPRWLARIAIAGTISDLAAGDGSLYATRGIRTSQLVRIDPATGRVEAAANRVTSIDSLAYAGGAIWTTGVPTARPAAPYQLVEFNAITLARGRAISLRSEYKPFVFAGPDGELWSGTGDSQVGACIIRRLSSVTGATEIARRHQVAAGEFVNAEGGFAFGFQWPDHSVNGGPSLVYNLVASNRASAPVTLALDETTYAALAC